MGFYSSVLTGYTPAGPYGVELSPPSATSVPGARVSSYSVL